MKPSYSLVRNRTKNGMRPILYIVRHGETALNAGKKFRGLTNVSLDENGRKQAEDVKKLLSGIHFSAGYSSDMDRAKQTLAIILSGTNTPVHVETGLRPWDVGKFTGQPKDQKSKKELQSYADNPDKQIPDGQSLNQFRDKYQEAFWRIALTAETELSRTGDPALIAQHASDCHEVGNILHGDIDTLDVDPGGVIVVFRNSNGDLDGEVLTGQSGDHSEYVS